MFNQVAWVWIAFAAYNLLLVGLGIYLYRLYRDEDLSKYVLAGRKLGLIPTALSAYASGTSGWGLVGITGMAYVTGLPMLWYATGGILWSYATFFLIGRRLRVLSGELDSLTLTDFFCKRFDDKNNILRVAVTVICLVFMIGYVASQMSAAGKAFLGFLDIGYVQGTIFSATVVIFYTFLSGFRGVAYTDVVQGGFLLIGLVALTMLGFVHCDGLSGLVGSISAQDSSLLTVTGGRALGPLLGFVFSWFASGAMGFGNPHVATRVMAIDDDLKLRNAGLLTVTCNVTAIYTGVWLGLIGRAVFPTIPDPELVFPMLAVKFAPPFVVGLFLSAVLAAIMSTCDSQLVLAATEVTTSIIQNMFGLRQLTNKTLVNITRALVVIIGIISTLFALRATQLVFWLTLFAWAGLGSAFGPLLIASLYWPKTSLNGAIAGTILGAATVVLWGLNPALKSIVYEGVPGFLVASLAIIVFSLLSKPPEKAEALFNSMHEYFDSRRAESQTN